MACGASLLQQLACLRKVHPTSVYRILCAQRDRFLSCIDSLLFGTTREVFRSVHCDIPLRPHTLHCGETMVVKVYVVGYQLTNHSIRKVVFLNFRRQLLQLFLRRVREMIESNRRVDDSLGKSIPANEYTVLPFEGKRSLFAHTSVTAKQSLQTTLKSLPAAPFTHPYRAWIEFPCCFREPRNFTREVQRAAPPR